MSFLDSLNPLDTLTNLFNTGYNVYQDQRNYHYQTDLQDILFKRDDNAMQRRMQDYKKAGINPLMALGSSAAGNSSAGGFSSPQVSMDNTFFSSQTTKRLEQEALKQEADKRKLEMEQMRINLRSGKIANWQAMQDLNTKRLEQDILKKHIEQMNTTGIYPLSAFGKSTVDFTNLVLPLLNNAFESIQKTLESHPEVEKILNQITDPSQIPQAKNIIQKKAQEISDFLGRPLFPKKQKFISEYEARVLRGNSDKYVNDSVIYGSTDRSGSFGKKSRKNKF